LWDAYQKHYGKDGDSVLVWQAPTTVMNPTIPEKVIEEAYEQDPEAASAEYGAHFRRDIESFVMAEAVESVVIPDRFELSPLSDFQYHGFCDPSGGSQDSFTLGIAHAENGKAILDVVRERRPPFSPEAVVSEFAELLQSYSVSTVQGDRYAGEWPREQFRKHGISYEPAQKTKSELYLELLPVINSGKVELLDNPRLLTQLKSLERRTSRMGRDVVDHSPGAHDDVTNACAGAVALVMAASGARTTLIEFWD
jgi:hypothetical protein